MVDKSVYSCQTLKPDVLTMSDKREELTHTALQLFYDNGINAIGINEILTRSGIAKKTLYSHFKSKEALLLAALQLRHEKFISWLEENLREATSDTDAVNRLFGALVRWFNDEEAALGHFKGCFFINTSAEFSNDDSPVYQFCSQHKKRVKEVVGRYLRANTDTLDIVCLLVEGAIVTAFVSGETEKPSKLALTLLSSMLNENK